MNYRLNIGDLQVTSLAAATFTCLGLGSCVGLFLKDRQTGLCGGAHIFLPEEGNETDGKHYSAKRAIDELLERFRQRGSSVLNVSAKLAGGAQVLAMSSDMGKRNVDTVVTQLRQRGVRIAAMHVGGQNSRSVTYHCQSGELSIRIPETNNQLIF